MGVGSGQFGFANGLPEIQNERRYGSEAWRRFFLIEGVFACKCFRHHFGPGSTHRLRGFTRLLLGQFTQVSDGRRMSKWFDCLIGFGSNLGDLDAAFSKTKLSLAALAGIRDLIASSPRLTKPVVGPGNPDQPQYLNAVFRLKTNLEAAQLHSSLMELERTAGRDRSGRWKPRSLDLDLLLYGTKILQSDSLRIPHPRMSVRRFVLEPAVEIAGEMVHPVASISLSALLDRLNRSPNQLVWVTESDPIAKQVMSGVKRQLQTAASKDLKSTGSSKLEPSTWTVVQVVDMASFEKLQSTAKIVVWSTPRPGGMDQARFAGPQIELIEKRLPTVEELNPKLIEDAILEFQSEIVAAIEAANG